MSTIYRSVYSGREIDEAIASMKASSDQTISNDFNGGTLKAASAELAKILNDRLLNIEDPTKFRDFLTNVPDFNIFTDANLATLNAIKTNFRGVYLNVADRDASVASETANYLGREICLVMDNGFGAAEFQKWDNITAKWYRVKLFGIGEVDPSTIATASTTNLFSFKTNTYNTMKVIVSVGTADGNQRQVQEAVLTAIGSDVYLSVYGEVGNATLFTLAATLVNGIANITITTLVPNLNVTAKQLALI